MAEAILRRQLYCPKCNSKIKILYKPSEMEEKWICEKHGEVLKAYSKT
jgi:hypothetical protein